MSEDDAVAQPPTTEGNAQSTPTTESAADAAPPTVTAADDEVIEAEIVPDPAVLNSSTGFAPQTPTGYTDSGVPTLDYVTERIEARIGLAHGTAELSHSQEIADSFEKQRQDREKLAAERLAAIRKSLS